MPRLSNKEELMESKKLDSELRKMIKKANSRINRISKEYGEELMGADSTLTENPNLLHAFDNTQEISDTNPDYLDVKVAFKVLDPNSNTYVITNKAQISEDADEDGEPVDDIDSVPDEWNPAAPVHSSAPQFR